MTSALRAHVCTPLRVLRSRYLHPRLGLCHTNVRTVIRNFSSGVQLPQVHSHQRPDQRKGERRRKIKLLGLSPDQILSVVTDHHQLEPCELSAALFHASKRPREVDGRLKTLLLGRLVEHTEQLKPVDLSNIFLACRRLKVRDADFWRLMCDQARKVVADFRAQHIANTLNALAHSGHKDGALVDALMDEAVRKAGEFKSQEIANTLNALAKFGKYKDAVVGRLCWEAIHKASDFNSQEIASTLNSLAKFGVYEEAVVTRLCEEAVHKASDFNAREIANTLNALAKLGVHEKAVVTRLCEEAVRKAGDCTSQGIANMLNALAKLGAYDEALVGRLCEETVRKVNDFNPQEIANTLNALVKFGVCEESVVRLLCEEAVRKAREFKPQEIANTLSGLNKLGVYNEAIVIRLCKEAVRKAGDFNAQDIAHTLYALAQFNMYNKAAIGRLCEEAVRKARTFNSLEIARTLSALAQFDVHEEPLVGRLREEAVRKARGFTPQGIATTLYALVCLEHHDKETFEGLWPLLVQRSNNMGSSSASNVCMVHLYLSLERPSWALSPLPADFQQRVLGWTKGERTRSKLLFQVSDALSHLPVQYENGADLKGMLVDIVVQSLGVVVEVDGPSRYFRHTRKVLGGRMFRKRVLRAMGWEVRTVVFYEWNALNGAKEQEVYMSNLLGLEQAQSV